MDCARALSLLVFLQVMFVEGQDSDKDSGGRELASVAGYFFRLRPVSVNPSSVNSRSLKEDNFVTFHLFNRVEQRSRGRNIRRTKKFQRVDPTKMDDTVSRMNSSLPTMIIIHGFLESNDAYAIKALLNSVSRRGRWNVVVVDWHKLSAGPWYPWALLNTRAAGRYVANFIDSVAAAIEESSSTSSPNDVSRAKRASASDFLKDLHIVGFSLGAHVAGIAGHHVTTGKVGRITGLDPAYPLIELLGPKSERLDKTDAEFVDVIHTSGGVFGTPFAVGHADFYPNGGKATQPGCDSLLFPLVCSHWRAWRYFAESILNEQTFESLPCDSWNNFNEGVCDHFMNDANHGPEYMGIGTTKRARGMYYLKTYPESPYSMLL